MQDAVMTCSHKLFFFFFSLFPHLTLLCMMWMLERRKAQELLTRERIRSKEKTEKRNQRERDEMSLRS